MKNVSFPGALEAQIGGRFYHFRAGSYSLEDGLADLVVANYGDRGVTFGTLSGERGAAPLEQADAEIAPEPEPDSALGRDATEAEVATADAADDAADDAAEDRADAPSRRGKRRTR